MAEKPYTKMSLIERSALTFESFLTRDFGNRFYQPEFLDGITARRMEVIARIGKGSSQAFLFATVLAFFDLISGSSFNYGGLTLQITKDLTPIISLLTAGALLNTTFAFIDDQIIYRILLKIGSHIKIQNFQLLLVDKMAHNLWGDAIVPRFFGQKSGRGQTIAVKILTFVVLAVSAAMYLYPAFMVVRVFLDLMASDARWIAKAIASLAVAVTVWALLLGAIFTTKFKFFPADWHESTDQPTEDFVRRMQSEIAKGDGSASDAP